MSGTLTTSTLKVYGPVTTADGADVSVALPDGSGSTSGTAQVREGIGLLVSVAGNVRVTRPDGIIVTVPVVVGWNPIRFKRLHTTGTTASGFTAGFQAY
jgi:hypothetical protein